MDVYVRPFEAGKPEAPGAGPIVRVATNGACGFIWKKRDGKGFYVLPRDFELLAVDVTSTSTFQVETPRVLLKLPEPLVASFPEGVSRHSQQLPPWVVPTVPGGKPWARLESGVNYARRNFRLRSRA